VTVAVLVEAISDSEATDFLLVTVRGKGSDRGPVWLSGWATWSMGQKGPGVEVSYGRGVEEEEGG